MCPGTMSPQSFCFIGLKVGWPLRDPTFHGKICLNSLDVGYKTLI